MLDNMADLEFEQDENDEYETRPFKRVRVESDSVIKTALPTSNTDESSEEAPVGILSYKSGAWQKYEDNKLSQAVAKCENEGGIDWTEVAKYVTDRSQNQCFVRWNALLKYGGMGSRRSEWTKEDDTKLEQAVLRHARKGGGVYWGRVSNDMGGTRTYQQCMKRWTQTLQHINTGKETGPWTNEEDSRLIGAMKIFEGKGKGGGVDWAQVSSYLGDTRAASQCYKRWHDALKQRRKVTDSEGWSEAEDTRIAEAVVTYAGEGTGGGVDWTKVAAHVNTTKTAKQCHKRWHRVLKLQSAHSNRVRTDKWEPEEDEALCTAIATWRTHNNIHSDNGSAASLSDLYSEMGRVDWRKVSLEGLKGRRTPRQCENRFVILEKERRGNKDLTDNCSTEDLLHNRSLAVHDDGSELLLTASLTKSTGVRVMPVEMAAISSVNAPISAPRLLQSSNGDALSSSSTHRGPVARAFMRTGQWSADEDDRLIEAVSLFDGQGRGGAIDWGRVCEYMGGDRTYDQCRVRWNGVLKVHGSKEGTVKRGPWSEVEDEELMKAVEAYVGKGKGGGIDWGQVSIQMRVERTPNQCHTRWDSVLKHRGKAQKKSRSWSESEDIRLVEAVTMFEGVGRGGSVDWSKVAMQLSGEHSSYQQRMRWHSVLKARLHPPNVMGVCDHAREKWSQEEIGRLMSTVESWSYVPTEGDDSHHTSLCDPSIVGEELMAHYVDWVAVASDLAERAFDGSSITSRGELGSQCTADSCAVAKAPPPLKCIQIWRQEMNARAKLQDCQGGEGRLSLLTCRNVQWTDQEDERLLEAVTLFDGKGRAGGIDWTRVCAHMGTGRTYGQCRHRWHNVLKHKTMMFDDSPRLHMSMPLSSESGVGVGFGGLEEDAWFQVGADNDLSFQGDAVVDLFEA